MFFHPGSRDHDGLLAFAHETGRHGDCVKIVNCVGKSMSKHRRKKKTVNQGYGVGSSNVTVLEVDERDRRGYFTPPAEVVHDYCDDVVYKYLLEDVEQKRR
ncbi:MAG: hypothetical protein Q9181_007752, partial [Wetmoreana brouardii]